MYKRQLELIVGGLDLDAETGEKWGYFNRSLPKEELDLFITRFLDRVASFSPESVRSAKEALQLSIPNLVRGLVKENILFNERNSSESGRELMKRFLDLGGQSVLQESRIEEFALEVAKSMNKPNNGISEEP